MPSIRSLYRQHLYVAPVAEDRDGIAEAQQRTGAGVLNLNGVLSSGGVYTAADGVADENNHAVKVGHQLSVYSAGNIATVVFTFVGKDPDGRNISETVTGVNNSTVETNSYFYELTSVSTSATIASDVEIGIVDEIATQRVLIEPRASGYDVGMGVHITGTASLTAQLSMSDPYNDSITPVYIADATLATKTASFYSRLGIMVCAVRCVTDSYSSGATFEFHVIQNK
jgi:hypothetical protein